MKLKLRKTHSHLIVVLFLVASISLTGLAQAVNTVTVVVGGVPKELAITPDGKYLYVTNAENVTVIDTSTNKVLTSIKTENRPTNVAISPDGKHAYVTHDDEMISVISTTTNVVSSTINIGGNIIDITITPNGEYAYVLKTDMVYNGSWTNAVGAVSVISTATEKVLTTVNIDRFPEALTITPDGKYVYVTNSDGVISVINTATNVETISIDVGKMGLSSIAITPDGHVKRMNAFFPCDFKR